MVCRSVDTLISNHCIAMVSIRDSNLNRFKEAFFGAFCRFLLACRQASGVGNNKNHSKNALFKVRSSFCEQFFCSDKENREVNPVGLTSGLTQYERKNCRKNRFVFGSLMLTGRRSAICRMIQTVSRSNSVCVSLTAVCTHGLQIASLPCRRYCRIISFYSRNTPIIPIFTR